MLAATVKLAENNLDVILEVLDGLRIVRENGGYGHIELQVQNGCVLVCEATVRKHLKKEPITHRA